jgi:hypothetical protein
LFKKWSHPKENFEKLCIRKLVYAVSVLPLLFHPVTQVSLPEHKTCFDTILYAVFYSLGYNAV